MSHNATIILPELTDTRIFGPIKKEVDNDNGQVGVRSLNLTTARSRLIQDYLRSGSIIYKVRTVAYIVPKVRQV